jgi:hypothetical protein
MCEDCQRLKRAVIRLRNDLKHERRKNATLLSEKKEKNHLRKGQKRGKHGFHG